MTKPEEINYNIHEIIERPIGELVSVQAYTDNKDLTFIPISFFGYRYNLYPCLDSNPDVKTNGILRICYTFPNERKSRNTILPTLRSGDVMIDVGACYGSWTLPAASMGINVIAIEPDEYYSNILIQQVKLNKFDKLVNIITGFAGKTKETSIDSYMEMMHIDKVRLIKIDTEGAEFDVLKGARKTIRKYKPNLLIELHTQMHGKTPEDELKILTKTHPFYKQHFILPQQAREQDEEYYHMYHMYQI